MTNTIIELRNVTLEYKERKSFFRSNSYKALRGVTFEIYEGETLGVIGRNGAGKSSLLRLLTGIFKPDEGEIIHHTKSVSLMALTAGFDPNLSGRQNAIFSGMLLGYSKKEMMNFLDEIYSYSELKEFFDKPIKTYSSGMKARLGFAIAMYASPDVLLIDEVLGVGDIKFRKKAEASLLEKLKSNITVILVSHSEGQMKKLADRIVWIENGMVRKIGKSESVYLEYNFEMGLERNGLKLESFNVNPNFFVHIDNIQNYHDYYNFECVIVNKDNKKLERILHDNNESRNFFWGPFNSPKFQELFPNNPLSSKSRFKSENNLIVGTNKIIAICNGEEIEVMNFVVTYDRERSEI